MSLQSFEELECWKACRQLRLFVVREVVTVLPSEEKFRLVDQLIRAARSTTANVAEGYGRYSFMDNRKFVGIARGSCNEGLDHMITAHDEGLISDSLVTTGKKLGQQAIRLLNGYMAYLKRADQGSTSGQ